jgi:hypothetical protein
MTAPHRLWLAQVDAAESIRDEHDVEKALGYLVGEKLLNFVRSAETNAAFARELPAFVARVREHFGPHKLRAYLDGVRRVGATGHVMTDEAFAFAREAGMFEEAVVESAEDVLRMERVREMLLG